MTQRNLPIGVFDSGVGGLTVVRAMRERLPGEDLLYLGDTARVPYGTRSAATVDRYAQQVAGHLVRRGVKALVVACNTATTYALEGLVSAGDRLGIPVIGVIAPGVNAALRATQGHIGVIGTEGTIRGGAYTRLIAQLAPEHRVSAIACPLFVALAEEGWTEGDIAQAVAARYLAPLRNGPDTLILACTHYPLLAKAIAKALPGVTLVDSARSTADAVAQTLAQRALLSTATAGSTQFLVTDNRVRFAAISDRFLGTKPSSITLINLDERDHAAWMTEVTA